MGELEYIRVSNPQVDHLDPSNFSSLANKHMHVINCHYISSKPLTRKDNASQIHHSVYMVVGYIISK